MLREVQQAPAPGPAAPEPLPGYGVLEALGLATIVVDQEGIVRHFNQGAADVLGVSAGETVGQPLWSLPYTLDPDSGQGPSALVRELLDTGGWKGELALLGSAGERLTLAVRVSVEHDSGGRPANVVAVLSDRTAVAHVHQQLYDLSEFSQATLDSLGAHVAVLDEAGTIVAVNKAWNEFSEREGSGADWIGTDYLEVCAASDEPPAARVGAGLAEMLAGERDYLDLEYPCHSPTERRWFRLRATAHRGVGPLRIVLAHESITPLRVAQEQVSLRGALLDEIDVAVIVTDSERQVLSWNACAERLYGWTRDEAVGAWLPELITPQADPSSSSPEVRVDSDGRISGEYTLARKDGSTFHAHVRTRRIDAVEDDASLLVSVSMDVSEQRAAERGLIRDRNYLRAVTDNIGDGLYVLDADGALSYMNAVAQELLGWTLEQAQGTPLHELVFPADRGDPAMSARPSPVERARQQHDVVRVEEDAFVRSDGESMPVSYTVAPFETDDGGEGYVIVFRDITERKAEADRLRQDAEKLVWVGRLQEALSEDRFMLYGQPIIDLDSGEVVQRELLIRMSYPEDAGVTPGLITPGRFLPVAEEYGFIAEIDRWVVDRAAELAAAGVAAELNVSARSITDASFIRHVAKSLAQAKADPAMLVFEITETALIGNEEMARTFVEQLHNLGCRIALDDFGTGYGGFTYLKQLPIDFLKIDIEFVRDLRQNAASRNVVEAVVSLARGFSMKTVAEGVEDADTLELLRSMGVDFAQGFHIGRPAPLDVS